MKNIFSIALLCLIACTGITLNGAAAQTVDKALHQQFRDLNKSSLKWVLAYIGDTSDALEGGELTPSQAKKHAQQARPVLANLAKKATNKDMKNNFVLVDEYLVFLNDAENYANSVLGIKKDDSISDKSEGIWEFIEEDDPAETDALVKRLRPKPARKAAPATVEDASPSEPKLTDSDLVRLHNRAVSNYRRQKNAGIKPAELEQLNALAEQGNQKAQRIRYILNLSGAKK